MAILKICPRCHKLISEGTTCSCYRKAKADRDRYYDRYKRDDRSRKFYQSKAWREKRYYTLSIDGCDVYIFMTTGRIIPADTVHHVIPLRDNWSRRFDLDNLMSLSSSTHSQIESMYDKDKAGMIRKLQKMLKDYRTNVLRRDG